MSRARVQLREVSRDFSIAAGCDAVYEVSDEALGVVGFIVLHDLARGPGFGGVRRLRYASEQAAVRDVVMLAEQMTLKTTLAGLPVGGAKAAILDRPGLDVERAYEALGDAVEFLDGVYFCGPDVGTGATELSYVRRRTNYVNHLHNQPASSTAKGVLLACDAALSHLARQGINVLHFTATVQGVGSVGRVVAEGLEVRGGTLSVADIDQDRLNAVMDLLTGATRLDPDAVIGHETFLFSPCALGPILTLDNIGTLRAKIVCGGANNQLATPSLALVLHEMGVLYVPEFAVNAGAVIEGVLRQFGGDGDDVQAKIDDAIGAIGPRVTSILDEAAEASWTPLEVALNRTEIG